MQDFNFFPGYGFPSKRNPNNIDPGFYVGGSWNKDPGFTPPNLGPSGVDIDPGFYMDPKAGPRMAGMFMGRPNWANLI